MGAEMDLQQHRPERLLLVAAHPGDAEVSMGGAIARWTAEGAVAALVCVTSGEAYGDDATADPLALAALREEEQRAAAAILGCEHVTFLHRPDGAVANDLALREQLVRIIRRVKPDVVAAPDPRSIIGPGGIVPSDHRAAGAAALDAVHPAAHQAGAFPGLARTERLGPHRVTRVMLYGSERPSDAIDIGATLATKLTAIRALGGIGRTADELETLVRERAQNDGRPVDLAAAELVSVLPV